MNATVKNVHAATPNQKRRAQLAKFLVTSALTAGVSMIASHPANAESWTQWHEQHNFTYETDGTTTTINTTANRAGGFSPDLDIHAGDTVQVNQQSKSSWFWAVADRDGNITQIRGALTSNGNIGITDMDGTIFLPGSRIDVGSIVATTGNLNFHQFLETGKMQLSDFGDGRIENYGTITVSDAGLAAFVSPFAANHGIINAKLGTVAFAAGDKVTLDMYGDGLFEIAVEGKAADALLENTGVIEAQGGTVMMTAQAAKNAVDNVINMDGVVTVASATAKGGKIILSGGNEGKVTVNGVADASGKTGGGKIEVKGQDIEVGQDALVMADSHDNGDGGDVVFFADNNAIYRGRFRATGGAHGGDGGFIELSARNQLGYDGSANTSAANGTAGSLLFDPEFAIIHSGSLNNLLGLSYILSAEALANDLAHNGTVSVQANSFIDVGTDPDGYNINTGSGIADAILNGILNGLGDGDIDLSHYSYEELVTPGYLNTSGPFWTWHWVDPVYQTVSGTTAGTLNLESANINFNRNLTLGTGNLLATASNSIAVNSAVTTSGGNALFNTGKFTVENTGSVQTNGGSITANGTQRMDIYGALASNGGDIALAANNNSFLYVWGDVNSGAGDTSLTAGSKLVLRTGSEIVADTLSTVAKEVEQFAGSKITANTLAGSTARNAAFAGTANDINNIGNFATGTQAGQAGGFSLVNNGRVNITGALTTDGGDVNIQNAGRIDVDTLVQTNGGNVTLAANGNDYIYVDGAINAGAGDTSLSASHIVMRNGSTITTDALSVSGKDVAQSAGSAIIANVLQGTLSKAASFLGLNNDINAIGNFATGTAGTYAGGFTLVNTGDLDVTGTLSTQGGHVDIDTSGDLAIESGASVNANGGHIDLYQGGAFSSVDGNSVITTGTGTITLAQHVGGFIQNAIDAILNTGTGKNTINVGAGDFTEQLDIDYSLDLIGAGKDVTNILAPTTLATNYSNQKAVIYAHDAGAINISDLTIDGEGRGNGNYRFAGLLYKDAGGVVDNIHVTGITDTPVSGNQHGNAVYYYNTDAASRNWTIQNSDIDTFQKNGISVSGAGVNASILNNTVTGNGPLGAGQAAQNGIQISGGAFALVDGNTISGISYTPRTYAATGILLYGAANGTTVSNNHFTGAGDDIAIYAYDSDDLIITDNTIDGSSWYGVELYDAQNALVSGNTISGAEFGVDVFASDNATVEGNTIAASVAGVSVSDSAKAWVRDNTIHGGDEGIVADNAFDLKISDNAITNAALNAIHVSNSGGTNYVDDLDIWANVITNSGDATGILVENSDYATIGVYNNPFGTGLSGGNVITGGGEGIVLTGSDNAKIFYNQVGHTSGNGIVVKNGDNAEISNNVLNTIGASGIVVRGSDLARVLNNTISGAGQHGVRGLNSDDLLIEGNTVYAAGVDGIHVNGGEAARILGNTIAGTPGFLIFAGSNGAGRDGIHVSGNDYVLIDGNTVKGSNGAFGARNALGAGRDAIHVEGSDYASITNNSVRAGDTGTFIFFPVAGGNAAGRNGIYTGGSYGVDITGNTVKNVVANGVAVSGSDNAYIYDNAVSLTGKNGLAVSDSEYAQIIANTVTATGENGVKVSDSDFADIRDNTVSAAGANGIQVANSSFASVVANTITGALQNGIRFVNASFAGITDNVISLVGANGIAGKGAAFALVEGNTVSGAAQNGIKILQSNLAIIRDNTITASGENGIQVDGSALADINTNRVLLSGGNGIQVGSSVFATLEDNFVLLSGGNGIQVRGSVLPTIANNIVLLTGGNGIQIGGSYGASVADNAVFLTAGNGISVNNSMDADIYSNLVGMNGANGIKVANSDGADVSENLVFLSANNGIAIVGGANVAVNDNRVAYVGGNGISGRGTDALTIDSNTVHDAARNGIALKGANGTNVNFNAVYQNGRAGLALRESDNTVIANNTFTDNARYGVYGKGDNGAIAMSGNLFTDNPVHARFESGTVDLTGASNVFNFGDVGLQFAGADVALLGNTIGAQFFNGQTLYFAELQDGAFFNPGTPSVIEALDSTYVTPLGLITPSLTGGYIGADTFAFLESKFFHFTDLNTLGLFFFGQVPSDINQEDLLRIYGGFAPIAGNIQFTMTGLPYISLDAAAALNNITPAAGGDGTDVQNIASIEPAAGGDGNDAQNGQDYTCWGDMANSAGSGQVVNVSFGTNQSAILNDAAGCQTGTF